jgi:hypothetical protein
MSYCYEDAKEKLFKKDSHEAMMKVFGISNDIVDKVLAEDK